MLETEVGSEHMKAMQSSSSTQAGRSVQPGPLPLSCGQGHAGAVRRLA